MMKCGSITLKNRSHRVDFVDTIEGKVHPPNSDVQVYILSGDNKWYLQKPATVRGSNFNCPCHFGFESSFDHPFEIVALLTSNRPGSPIDELPSDVVSSAGLKVKRWHRGG